MKIEDLDLTIHEHCIDDNALTVQGRFPHSLDLASLAEIGRGISSKVILMNRLDVLYIVLDKVTVHLHGNGELLVNNIKSLQEAENILSQLTAEK